MKFLGTSAESSVVLFNKVPSNFVFGKRGLLRGRGWSILPTGNAARAGNGGGRRLSAVVRRLSPIVAIHWRSRNISSHVQLRYLGLNAICPGSVEDLVSVSNRNEWGIKAIAVVQESQAARLKKRRSEQATSNEEAIRYLELTLRYSGSAGRWQLYSTRRNEAFSVSTETF